jgi:hypothetical protein
MSDRLVKIMLIFIEKFKFGIKAMLTNLDYQNWLWNLILWSKNKINIKLKKHNAM